MEVGAEVGVGVGMEVGVRAPEGVAGQQTMHVRSGGIVKWVFLWRTN